MAAKVWVSQPLDPMMRTDDFGWAAAGIDGSFGFVIEGFSSWFSAVCRGWVGLGWVGWLWFHVLPAAVYQSEK